MAEGKFQLVIGDDDNMDKILAATGNVFFNCIALHLK